MTVVASVNLLPDNMTATSNSDFQFTSANLIFMPQGRNTTCTNIEIEEDDIIEDNERFTLSLSSDGAAVIVSASQTQVVIQDSSVTNINFNLVPDATLTEGSSIFLCFESTAPLERNLAVIISFDFFGSKSTP